MFILSRQGVTRCDIHIDNFICLCLGCKRPSIDSDSQVEENKEYMDVILINTTRNLNPIFARDND